MRQTNMDIVRQRRGYCETELGIVRQTNVDIVRQPAIVRQTDVDI